MILNRLSVMLDIETMATTPDATVYEVGAIRFQFCIGQKKTPYAMVHDEEHWLLHMRDQDTRRIDPGTVKWMHNTPGRMDAMCKAVKDGISIEEWASSFHKFLEGRNMIWCKGPHFDISILESLFQDARGGHWVPWRYSDIRDLRTIDDACEIMGIPVISEEPPHDALADCKLQLKELESIVRGMYSLRDTDFVP